MGRNKIGIIILWALISGLFFLVQQRWWLRPNFVDEQDNFVVGNVLTEGGKVYREIFSHHQPVTYIVSELIQKGLNPGGIFMLVKYHRMFIFAWSMAWWLLITLNFGRWVLIPMVIMETIKRVYLGNLFLAESLVMLPMIFLGLWLLEKKEDSLKTATILGMMIAFCGLTLAPLWPALGLISIIFGWRWKDKRIVAMITGMLVVTGIIACQIDIGGYFREAILINQKYYVSIASAMSPGKTAIYALLSSFLYLINQNKEAEVVIIKICIGIFLLGLAAFGLKNRKAAIIIYGVLACLNLRDFEFEKIYYNGFHLIVWVGWLVVASVWLTSKQKKRWWWLWILPIMLSLLTVKGQLKEKNNLAEDFEIYYSQIFNTSEAIKAATKGNERLISMPDEVLAYWRTGVRPAGKYIFFYKWMVGVPEMREAQLENFSSKPEYLIIKGLEKLPAEKYLEAYQNFKYRGKESIFYIRKDRWEGMDEKIKKQVGYYGFEAINE